MMTKRKRADESIGCSGNSRADAAALEQGLCPPTAEDYLVRAEDENEYDGLYALAADALEKAKLTEREAMALHLTVFEDFTYAQLSVALGSNKGTCHRLVKSALRKVRRAAGVADE